MTRLKLVKSRLIIFIWVFAFLNTSSISALESLPTSKDWDINWANSERNGSSVVKIYFTHRDDLDRLASKLDIWEVNHAENYLIASISKPDYTFLINAGYKIEIEAEKTNFLNQAREVLDPQVAGIPGFLCYRTVEQTFQDISQLASDYPTLVSWKDIGDSWQKAVLGDQFGNDIIVLVLGNQQSQLPQPKPIFFLMGAIHAREYATAETAIRFAEHLLTNYGTDPDITWLLDYSEIHILPIANPDGRKIAEQGYGQRKNINNHNGGSCSMPPSWENQFGTDLNRNHTFQWGGSATNPCSNVYQGPSPGSEPETKAIESYLRSIFPDQRGTEINAPAPLTSTGILISLHSYGELILWPWGWSNAPAPNDANLRMLGQKFSFFNNYTPQQSYYLYQTTGDTDDFIYGELGIAAYTFELGTTFFESCTIFEDTIYSKNLGALLYAAKAARRPYQNPSGPDTLIVSTAPGTVYQGTSFTLTAVVDDTRYYPGIPTQNISAARYSIDAPSWITGTITYPLNPTDGKFDNFLEYVQANIDTTSLVLGSHTIFVEGQDSDGNWGIPSAAFVNLESKDYIPALDGYPEILQIKPGSSITQTIQVINRGLLTDTYNLEIEDNAWETSLDTDQVGPIVPGDMTNVQLTITVPQNIEDNTTDQFTIRARSLGDPNKSVEALLIVKVSWLKSLFPLIFR